MVATEAKTLESVLAGVDQLNADELRAELNRLAERDRVLRTLLRAVLARDAVRQEDGAASGQLTAGAAQ